MTHEISIEKKGYMRCTCGSEFNNYEDWVEHRANSDG